MALDMLHIITHSSYGNLPLTLRIGINSGPVVAGIIGNKKFIYDLWGDAVNTANRKESHGLSNQIQVSESTYELLKEKFILEPRGEIDVYVVRTNWTQGVRN
jgi:class 3 adenylate cyclase